MRHFILAAAATLALAVLASPTNAQIIIYNSNTPSAPGVHVINTPPFYNGLAFNNGVITALPVAPRYYGYPAYGYPYPAPYYGYSSYPNRFPVTPGGYNGYYPGSLRP